MIMHRPIGRSSGSGRSTGQGILERISLILLGSLEIIFVFNDNKSPCVEFMPEGPTPAFNIFSTTFWALTFPDIDECFSFLHANIKFHETK